MWVLEKPSLPNARNSTMLCTIASWQVPSTGIEKPPTWASRNPCPITQTRFRDNYWSWERPAHDESTLTQPSGLRAGRLYTHALRRQGMMTKLTTL